MIVVDSFTQGTEEWYAARCGVITASNFDKVVTSKGAPSKQSTKYLYRLAAERVTGTVPQSYTNAAMQRGTEIEPEARAYYELMEDVSVREVALCYRDEEKTVSCSPDGLVGDEGGLEIKCPLPETHIEYLLAGKLPTAYIQQVQGSLYVTGREWWDFLSYCPGLKPLQIRVQRDEAFIAKLEAALDAAIKNLTQIIGAIS